MLRSTFAACAAAAMVFAATATTTARAVVTVNFSQVGADVVVNTSGALNLTGLSLFANDYTLIPSIRANRAAVQTGISGTILDAYNGFSGPTNFGTGTTYAGVGSGATAFAIGNASTGSPLVFVQTGYVSGSAIASTLTFANSTFASLGLTLGSYTYSSSNDSINVVISNTAPPVVGAVPEPTTWAMMLGGFGMVGGAIRRRRRYALAV